MFITFYFKDELKITKNSFDFDNVQNQNMLVASSLVNVSSFIHT